MNLWKKLFRLNSGPEHNTTPNKNQNSREAPTDWPALVQHAPEAYNLLSSSQRERCTELSDDFCIIKYPEQTDHFIRASLYQKVSHHSQQLLYSCWVSISEQSFKDYAETFMKGNKETGYFGWLLLQLPEYGNGAVNIPCDVIVSSGSSRPLVIPHPGFDHPLVKDFHEGISLHEAERRVKTVLSSSQ